MKCKKCGNELSPNASFCGKCGTKVEQIQDTPKPLITKHCRKCGRGMMEHEQFCSQCGTRVERICPQCGNRLSSQAIFCDKCGSKTDVENPPINSGGGDFANQAVRGINALKSKIAVSSQYHQELTIVKIVVLAVLAITMLLPYISLPYIGNVSLLTLWQYAGSLGEIASALGADTEYLGLIRVLCAVGFFGNLGVISYCLYATVTKKNIDLIPWICIINAAIPIVIAIVILVVNNAIISEMEYYVGYGYSTLSVTVVPYLQFLLAVALGFVNRKI